MSHISVSQTPIFNTSVNTNLSGNNSPSRFAKLALVIATGVVLFLPTIWPTLWAAEEATKKDAAAPQSQKNKLKLDRSGNKQVGEASIYSSKFANKRMADGNLMDPQGDNAASKTLPFGTRVRVTNLETGQSTEVTIQDRGPHVKGRIIDLPLAKAQEIGISIEDGVAQVEVAPIEVPQRNGSVKLGDGAISIDN